MKYIAIRFCGKGSSYNGGDRPKWFSKDKCVRSVLKEACGSGWAVRGFRNGPESQLDDIFRSFEVPICPVNGNKQQSHRDYLDVLDSLEWDNVYYCEDDHLHRPGWLPVMEEGLARYGMISLYDHMDRYTRHDGYNRVPFVLEVGERAHWRTCDSTVCTFAIRRDVYAEVKKDLLCFLDRDCEFFRAVRAKGRILWGCVPGWSTHCTDGLLSPCVDWAQVAEGV
jgi:hypothetical protein